MMGKQHAVEEAAVCSPKELVAAARDLAIPFKDNATASAAFAKFLPAMRRLAMVCYSGFLRVVVWISGWMCDDTSTQTLDSSVVILIRYLL